MYCLLILFSGDGVAVVVCDFVAEWRPISQNAIVLPSYSLDKLLDSPFRLLIPVLMTDCHHF